MNKNKYDKLVGNYISKLDLIYEEGHKEYFKWKAIAQCRGEWNLDASDFGQMFTASFRMAASMIDTPSHKPVTAIGMLSNDDQYSETIRDAFRILLGESAKDNADLEGIYRNFTHTINPIIRNVLKDDIYLQTIQDVVFYLAFIEPEHYFMFRPQLVKSVGLRLDAITPDEADKLSLAKCYAICNELHELIIRDYVLNSTLDKMLSLQEERDGRISGIYTKMPGKSNIMVYELIYTAEIYGLYNGIRRAPIRKAIERPQTPADLKREHYISEQNRLLALKIRYERELAAMQYPDVTGFTVSNKKYGAGKIAESTGSTVSVEFKEGIKKFAFPDCFSNGFLTTSDSQITSFCEKQAELRAKLSKLDGNISTLKIMLSKMSAS